LADTGVAADTGLLVGEAGVAPAGGMVAPACAGGVGTAAVSRAPRAVSIPHLLRRATYGITPGLVAEVTKQTSARWLERQLRPQAISDTLCDKHMARFPLLARSTAQIRATQKDGSWQTMQDLGAATVLRAAWSKRQLFELMVEFWSNHLNVTCPFGDAWDTRHRYDADVIRRHALGRFSDMLVASALHPAMLVFLNNDVSEKNSPNENFGRELLELHTVGVDGGYSEAEMRTSALVMTGCSIDWEIHAFLYRPTWHHTGRVSVLGWSSANASAAGGLDVAKSYLRYLALHPKTAQHIARKLVTRFVGDVSSDALVAALTQTYLRSGSDIRPVLRQLFHSAQFKASAGQKVRRPYEDLIATVRALGLGPDTAGTKGSQSLFWMAGDMGHAPLGWHPPDGYPDVAGAWQSASGTLGRWNAHLNIAARWWPDTLTGPPARKLLPATLPATWGGVVDALAQRLLTQRLSSADRGVVLTFLQRSATGAVSPDDEWLGWKLPFLVALVLDLPVHGRR